MAVRLRHSFGQSSAEGLLALAGRELDAELPADFVYWRGLAREFFSRLCHLGEFDTTKLLYQLLQSGYVERREEKRTIKMGMGRPGDSIDDMYGRIIDTFNMWSYSG